MARPHVSVAPPPPVESGRPLSTLRLCCCILHKSGRGSFTLMLHNALYFQVCCPRPKCAQKMHESLRLQNITTEGRQLKAGKGGHRTPTDVIGQERWRARRRIGLVCNGRGPSDDAVRYALNACESLGAGLDVLQFRSPGAEDALLESLLPCLADRGIDFHILSPGGDERRELLRYANETTDTLFVVIDAKSWKSISGTGTPKRGTLSPWDSQCPLVVITETTPAAKGQALPDGERAAQKTSGSTRGRHETGGGKKPTT